MSNPIWKLSIDANISGNIVHQNGQNWNSGQISDSFTMNLIDKNGTNRSTWIQNLGKLIKQYPVVFLDVTSSLGTFPNSATYIVKSVTISGNIAQFGIKFYSSFQSSIGGDNALLNLNYYN